MACIVPTPEIVKLHSYFPGETLSSVRNMVGLWQEREIESGNTNVTLDSVPSGDELRKLYASVRAAEKNEFKLPRAVLDNLLIDKELPDSLLKLARNLGIKISLNKRTNTVTMSLGSATKDDMRLFRALAIDFVYADYGSDSEEGVESINSIAANAFGMTPRERASAIIDWETVNRKKRLGDVSVMNYEIQVAKRNLGDNNDIIFDSVMEVLRRNAARAFTSQERSERVSEFVTEFDYILSDEIETRKEELAKMRDDIFAAKKAKDTSLYVGDEEISEEKQHILDLLDSKIDDYGVSVRLHVFLSKNTRLKTIRDVVESKNKTAFAKRFNLNGNMLKEIYSIVDGLGLSFGMEIPTKSSPSWDKVEAFYDRRLGELQDKISRITRLNVLKEIGANTIFDEIREKYARIANTPIDDKTAFAAAVHDEFGVNINFVKKNAAWYRSQAQKVLDNFTVLASDACKDLEVTELVHINISANIIEKLDNSKNSDEVPDGTEENDNEGEDNQYKESWMFDYDVEGCWAKTKEDVRMLISKCTIGKRNTRFGSPYRMPTAEVLNTLIREMHGVTNSRDMLNLFKSLRGTYSWIGYICDEISANKKLRSELFRSIRLYPQSLGVIRKGDKQKTYDGRLNIVNSGNTVNRIYGAALNYINYGIPINHRTSIFDGADFVYKNIDAVLDIIDEYTSEELKEIGDADYTKMNDIISLYPDLIDDVFNILTSLGFAISRNDVQAVANRPIPKNAYGRKNNIALMIAYAKDALNKIKSNEYSNVSELLNENRDVANRSVLQYYNKIAETLTVYDNGTVESSIRENGKLHYTEVRPSFLDDLITGLQGKTFSHIENGKRVNMSIKDFIIKRYGDDPFYAKKTENPDGTFSYEFRNYILQFLTNDEMDVSRTGPKYVTLLNVDTGRIAKTEQKNLTQEDRLNVMWAMYHMNDTSSSEKSYDNVKGHWFNIPLPSDSGRMGYIAFPAIEDNDMIDKIISEQILKELDRMTNISDESNMPETYLKNKGRFCTFPFLNNEGLTGYKLDFLKKEYIKMRDDTGQTNDMDDILNTLVGAVKTSLIDKFAKQNPSFYHHMAKEKGGYDYVDSVVLETSLFQMAINELTNGDAAFYESYTDEQKRGKQTIVPLHHYDIFNEDFLDEYKKYHGITTDNDELTEDDITEHCLYIDDRVVPSPSIEDIKKLYKKALEDGLIDQQIYKDFIDSASEIKYTDGQAFRSFESTLYIMYALGELERGDERDLAFRRIASGKQQDGDELIVRAAFKSFGSGLINVANRDGEIRLVPFQHKLSEQLLTAALIQAKGTMIGDSPSLQALAEIMKQHRLDTVMFTSCVKVGQNGSVNLDGANLANATKEQIVEHINKAIDKYRRDTGVSIIHEIPYAFKGIVSTVPEDTIEDSNVVVGAQMQKILPSDLPDKIYRRDENGRIIDARDAVYHVDGVGDLSRGEVISLYNKLMTEKIIRAAREVDDTFNDKQRLSEALMRACRNSARNSSYLERAFSLDEYGNLVIPLCDPATLNMSSEFLNSIIKNAVSSIRVPGKQLVSMSPFGVAEKLKINFDEDKDGNIRYASMDCLMPAWSKHIVNKCVDENGIIDYDLLAKESPELMNRIIGIRVPTQYRNFILPLRCVGFLPTILGDSIITAMDSVVFQDGDFDYDKLFVLLSSFEADYHIDNWKKQADKDYMEYTNKYYDYRKLKDDFKDFILLRKKEGIDNSGYSFGDFMDERLGDPEYEVKYRRPDAPEGKPISYRQFVKENESNYLLDRPKISYIHYDESMPVEEQSDEQINNGIISVMKSMLTSEAVSTMSVAIGSPSRFDNIIAEIEAQREGSIYEDGPADIAARIGQETRNNDGKQMISVFASSEAIQSLLQHTNMRLADNVGVTINGRYLDSLHDVNVADTLNFISRNMGDGVGASADNSKKPRLSAMNMNLRTASVTSLLLQLGYDMKEVAFFLNIPTIREYTNTTGMDVSDIELQQELPGTTDDMINAIKAGDDYIKDDDMAEYCNTALGVYLYLENVAKRFRLLASLSRGDSGSTRPHGSIENNLVRLINYELFQEMEAEDKMFENWEDMVRYDYETEVLNQDVSSAPNPIAQAYITYGVVGAFKKLEEYYPGISNEKFRAEIKNIIKKYYNGYANPSNVKNILFSLYNYMESAFDCLHKDDLSLLESRNYYIYEFPNDAAELLVKYPYLSSSLLFSKLNLFPTDIERYGIFISLDTDGAMHDKVRDNFTATWQQMFYAVDDNGKPNNEIREMALDLYKYCYYRNGFRFSDGTYSHLAPAEARIFMPGYAEMLNSMLVDIDSFSFNSFEIQFVRNNLYDSTFAQTVPTTKKVRYPDGLLDKNQIPNETCKIKYRSAMREETAESYSWYFKGDDEAEIPRETFVVVQKIGGKLKRFYYVKSNDDNNALESTYTLTTPLGWAGKAMEFSIRDSGFGLRSIYDQDDVADNVRPSKRKSRKGAGAVTKGLGQTKESPEEPNTDTFEDYKFEGFWVSSFTGEGYKDALRMYPDTVNGSKFKKARAKFLKQQKEGKAGSKKTPAKSKNQVKKEKEGGKKSKSLFTEKAVSGNNITDVEKRCASEFGAYTIGIFDKESRSLSSAIHSVTKKSHWVSDFYDRDNVWYIANSLAKNLASKTVKSVVLNLTGSHINSLGKYATQEDLDSYVLNIYKSIKKKGIYISKVVSSAQPGIALASARAAVKLGYKLEILHTHDYKVYNSDGSKVISGRDELVSNVSSASASKDYKENNRVYDKEDGPVIEAKREWTRSIVTKDVNTLYVFPDNLDRSSGNNMVPRSTRYSKRHGELINKNYPDKGLDSIRGCENAFPITLEKAPGVEWENSDAKQFAKVIKEDIDDIISSFKSYRRVVLPVGGVFGYITKEEKSALYKILDKEMDRLYDAINEMSDSEVVDDVEEGDDSPVLKYDNDVTLTADYIIFTADNKGSDRSNVIALHRSILNDNGISLYKSNGVKLDYDKLFIVLPKDVGDRHASLLMWREAKIFNGSGKLVTEKVYFKTSDDDKKYDLLRSSDDGAISKSFGLFYAYILAITESTKLNKRGMTWFDDNNEVLC